MQTLFANAVVALREVSLDNLVRQINFLFEQVARMDKLSATATWQTLDTLTLSIQEGSKEREVIQKFTDAVVARMVAIHSECPSYTSQDRLKKTFLAVIGEQYASRFKNCMEK